MGGKSAELLYGTAKVEGTVLSEQTELLKFLMQTDGEITPNIYLEKGIGSDMADGKYGHIWRDTNAVKTQTICLYFSYFYNDLSQASQTI